MGKGDSTRSSIVDRATELSSTVGLEGVSIGMLAEDLKLSKSGLFAHFRSKEALQLAMVEQAGERFTRVVVRPSLAAPRGEPRVRAAFENWRAWPERASLTGGCFFLAAAAEFDDRPGVVRDAVAAQISAWLSIVAEIVRGAVREGHFHAEVDAEQFAFEMFGLMLSYHQLSRLLQRKDAKKRANAAFEQLILRSLEKEPAPKKPARARG